MKTGDRLYLIEDVDCNGWSLVSTVPKDPTLRRKALVALTAVGCPRDHAGAILHVSQATLTRDLQYLGQAVPTFGTDEWRLQHLEAEAARLRRKLDREADADKAIAS